MSDMKADWISPPGDTILDILDERCWTITDLAERLDMRSDHVGMLLDGTMRISEDIAMRLESTLGSTAQFWLNREAQYRTSVESSNSAGGCHG